MCPGSTADYSSNCGLTINPESGGKAPVGEFARSIKPPDLFYFLLGELGRRCAFSYAAPKNPDGMAAVFSWREPFKIFWSIITRIAVFMVCHFSRRATANKGFGNQCVNAQISSFRTIGQLDCAVATSNIVRLENFTLACSWLGTFASDVTKIGYRIVLSIADHWPPDFHFPLLSRPIITRI